MVQKHFCNKREFSYDLFLLAHVLDQLLHGGNFSKLFPILSMIDLVSQLSELCQLSFICFIYICRIYFSRMGIRFMNFFLIWVSEFQSSDVTCRIASCVCLPANFFVCVREKQWGLDGWWTCGLQRRTFSQQLQQCCMKCCSIWVVRCFVNIAVHCGLK